MRWLDGITDSMDTYETYSRGPKKGQIKPKSVKWYGRVIRTGKYARSIHHRIMTEGDQFTEGEIGSPSMPGLPHLLEKGHGYYPAKAKKHIEPAFEEAKAGFEKSVDQAVERAINDV